VDIELFNAVLNAGGTGVIVWLLIRLENRMAERDKQIWALLEWLIQQPRMTVPPPMDTFHQRQ